MHFKLKLHTQIISYFLLICILLLACGPAKKKFQTRFDLLEYFNSKGKWARFTNSNLIFGDTLNSEIKQLLKFDSGAKIKYYRKAAYLDSNKGNTIIYFMYGTSVSDSTISQLRIRSFKNETLIGDYLIFDFKDKKDLSYDYRMSDNDKLTFFSRMKNGKAHYFTFTLGDGLIINTTFIPDSIYRRLDYRPGCQRVRIYEDFNSKKIDINGKKARLSGTIVNFYGGGKSSDSYMIIQLDKNPLITQPFVVTLHIINDETKLFTLNNDSLQLREDLCFFSVKWPIEKPVLIKDRVYVEYD